MLIHHKQNDSNGFFFIGEIDNRQAQMTYSLPTDDKMILEHIEVNDKLGNKNVGYQLVNHAVEYARGHNIKIFPLCLFAAAVFNKKPEYADVLSHN